MAETTVEQPVEETELVDIEQYTTESEVPVEGEYTSESLASRFGEPQPAAGLGRRKNAIARVRIVPGTGKWKVNGRTLEDYFPNKVHQQEVNEPFKVLELDNRYRVIAHCLALETLDDEPAAAAGFSLPEIRAWALDAWPKRSSS